MMTRTPIAIWIAAGIIIVLIGVAIFGYLSGLWETMP
jgi:hypothetical protein